MASQADKERLDTVRARHDAASTNWTLTYDRDRNEELSANLLPKVPAAPIATLTADCGYQDRDFLLNAHADMHFLFGMLANAFRKIRSLQKEMEEPRPDLSKECSTLCDDVLFRRFLSEKHGIATSDRERIATSVRKMLQIESRSELNTIPAAAKRWQTLLSRFHAWKDFA